MPFALEPFALVCVALTTSTAERFFWNCLLDLRNFINHVILFFVTVERFSKCPKKLYPRKNLLEKMLQNKLKKTAQKGGILRILPSAITGVILTRKCKKNAKKVGGVYFLYNIYYTIYICIYEPNPEFIVDIFVIFYNFNFLRDLIIVHFPLNVYFTVSPMGLIFCSNILIGKNKLTGRGSRCYL